MGLESVLYGPAFLWKLERDLLMGGFNKKQPPLTVSLNALFKWAAKHAIKHMFESHHTGRLFPNIQKLPEFKPQIDAVRAENIQSKYDGAVYLCACVQIQ